MNNVGSIYPLPVYPLSIDWTISDYYNMPQRADTYFNSPIFMFEEYTWCLRLYPNGCRIDSTVGDVELNLVRMSAGKPCHVSYTLGLKNGDGTVYNSKLIANYFFEVDDECGDEIIERSDLLRCRRTISPNNKLTVFIKDLIQHNKLSRDACVQTINEKVCNEPTDPLITQKENEEIGNKTMNPSITHNDSIETLLKNFKNLFLNKENCDVTFKVQNEEFQAHRSILIARSPYFASMFRHNMSEKNTGIVNVPDCCPGAFKELLLYLYSGATDTLTTYIIYDLYEVAIKYELECLKKRCVKFMEDYISSDTFCDILAVALKYNESELISYAIDFFAKHMLDILPTVKWQLFLQENPIAANELYMKAAQKK